MFQLLYFGVFVVRPHIISVVLLFIVPTLFTIIAIFFIIQNLKSRKNNELRLIGLETIILSVGTLLLLATTLINFFLLFLRLRLY